MSDNATRKEFLARTPFFGGLEEEALDRFVPMLVERQVPAGSPVFKEGETGRSMYVLEAGEILMKRTGARGVDVKLVRLHPGDFFGETTLIEMQPRPCTAFVEQDASLLEVSAANLYALYNTDVKSYVLVLQNINRELCRRLRRADNRIIQLADEACDEETQIRVRPLRP